MSVTDIKSKQNSPNGTAPTSILEGSRRKSSQNTTQHLSRPAWNLKPCSPTSP